MHRGIRVLRLNLEDYFSCQQLIAMSFIRAKRSLSQHFLIDRATAQRIVALLSGHGAYGRVLEIGPGLGALTRYLVKTPYEVHAVELDKRLVERLESRYADQGLFLHCQDILLFSPETQLGPSPLALIGNLPYHLSASVLFYLLDWRSHVLEAVFMLQEEVARRLVSAEGTRQQGWLTVLLSAYYHVEYCFSIPATAFAPRPKVESAVICLQRKSQAIDVSYEDLKRLLKAAFAKRRKILNNALQGLLMPTLPANVLALLQRRAETLTLAEFLSLAPYLLPQAPPSSPSPLSSGKKRQKETHKKKFKA